MEVSEMMESISKIYDWLSDEQSKEIYINRLNFLITGDYRFMNDMIHKYLPDMAALNDGEIPQLLSKLPKDKGIVLYGAGEDAKANLHYFSDDIRFEGFCDGNKEKQKNGVMGYDVISPEELIRKEDVSIVISTHRGYQEIREYLLAHGICEDRIYKMSPYMFAAQEEQYFNTDFLKYDDEEVFVDAGCCDLSTAIKLSKHCKKVKKVYAFEPDPDNYKRCLERKNYFEDNVVEVLPNGTWSTDETLFFNSTADGASHVTDSGELSIEVTTIDNVVKGKEKVTFIKMDVEGAELESLKGAKNTIMKDKPKLAICIYHKPEDMLDIPIFIKALVPEYKLYIRHHSNGAGETVLYAIYD